MIHLGTYPEKSPRDRCVTVRELHLNPELSMPVWLQGLEGGGTHNSWFEQPFFFQSSGSQSVGGDPSEVKQLCHRAHLRPTENNDI